MPCADLQRRPVSTMTENFNQIRLLDNSCRPTYLRKKWEVVISDYQIILALRPCVEGTTNVEVLVSVGSVRLCLQLVIYNSDFQFVWASIFSNHIFGTCLTEEVH